MASTYAAIFSLTLSPPRSTLFVDFSSPLPSINTNLRSSISPALSSFSPIALSSKPIVLRSSPLRVNSMSDMDSDVPMPIVLIDQDSDPVSTIVQLSFGDRLGALIDTMRALKDLGLDVSKGTVLTEGTVKQTKLFITHLGSGRKVEDPDMLERIRLTIIQNLLKYHPESSERLAMGEAFGVKAPQKKPDVDIATHIYVQEDGPKRSLLYIETADRSGLLMEVIKIIADINVNVESAEIETVGLVAKVVPHSQ